MKITTTASKEKKNKTKEKSKVFQMKGRLCLRRRAQQMEVGGKQNLHPSAIIDTHQYTCTHTHTPPHTM